MSLEVTDLSLSFAERRIFDGLSFSFESGKVYRLCGGSGTGKSTLLRSLSQLQVLDAGEVQLSGQGNLSMMDFRSKVLYFPQQAKVSLETVREELLFPFSLKIYSEKAKPNDESLRTYLAKLGLDYLSLGQSTFALSPGEQQRLSFARTFFLSPEFLLVDEPFSAVDEVNAQQMWELMLAEQKEQGFAVIFVQHQSYPWMEDDVVNLDLKDGKLSERVEL